MLQKSGIDVIGTLDEPIHAINLRETIEKCKNRFVIALDACLGSINESVGYINIQKGPLRPGTGVNKNLPAIGNVQIIGIVNVGGFMEYMVLQNTCLGLVMKMAEIIADIIKEVVSLKLNETVE